MYDSNDSRWTWFQIDRFGYAVSGFSLRYILSSTIEEPIRKRADCTHELLYLGIPDVMLTSGSQINLTEAYLVARPLSQSHRKPNYIGLGLSRCKLEWDVAARCLLCKAEC